MQVRIDNVLLPKRLSRGIRVSPRPCAYFEPKSRYGNASPISPATHPRCLLSEPSFTVEFSPQHSTNDRLQLGQRRRAALGIGEDHHLCEARSAAVHIEGLTLLAANDTVTFPIDPSNDSDRNSCGGSSP